MIPARDAHGLLHTLQFIGRDGDKPLLSGGRIQACYCAIAGCRHPAALPKATPPLPRSMRRPATPPLAHFNAGNLAPVARALRAKFPSLRIIVCADNDTQTPETLGSQTPGRLPAPCMDGCVPHLRRKSPMTKKSDFNDLAQEVGPEAVRTISGGGPARGAGPCAPLHASAQPSARLTMASAGMSRCHSTKSRP